MRQTWALLVDAYRDINSRKMFWIVLILSALVASCFACVNLTPTGLKIAFWNSPFPITSKMESNAVWQKKAFVSFGIEIWLTWIASILAIISTASIFPSFLTGGSVDLYLSKPISRLRLFITKYVLGLLFVALQVACYCLASYLVIGLRGGEWKPAIFLAVPIVVLFYSYIFCFCVLLGVITRSTVTAILLTLVFWLFIFTVQFGEKWILYYDIEMQDQIAYLDKHIEQLQRTIAADKQPAATRSPSHTGGAAPSPDHMTFLQSFVTESPLSDHQSMLVQMQSQRQNLRQSLQTSEFVHQISYDIENFFPKTSRTVDLLERELIKHANLPPADADDDESDDPFNTTLQRERNRIEAETETQLRARPITSVVGTSLIFEGVVLLLAAWIFCRRDY